MLHSGVLVYEEAERPVAGSGQVVVQSLDEADEALDEVARFVRRHLRYYAVPR